MDAPQTQPRRLDASLLLALTLSLVLLTNSVRSFPGPELPPIGGVDKILHLLYFGLLATLFYRSALFQSTKRPFLLAVLITGGVGVADEAFQSLSIYRTVDGWDLLADLIGACLALTLYIRWQFYRNLLEFSINSPPGKNPRLSGLPSSPKSSDAP